MIDTRSALEVVAADIGERFPVRIQEAVLAAVVLVRAPPSGGERVRIRLPVREVVFGRELVAQFLLHALDGARELRERVGVKVVFADEVDELVNIHAPNIAEKTVRSKTIFMPQPNKNAKKITPKGVIVVDPWGQG